VGTGATNVAKAKPADDVSIGKFDILATYTYARALLDGVASGEARERGMVAAIMGAKARLGHSGDTHEDHKARKDDAERKKKTRITAESFDKQVADKMGEFFEDVFLPTMETLVEAGLFYDEVKKLLEIPATWGAKIGGEQFVERAASVVGKGKKGPTPRPRGRRPLDDDDD
jgi:hypothetical protein